MMTRPVDNAKLLYKMQHEAILRWWEDPTADDAIRAFRKSKPMTAALERKIQDRIAYVTAEIQDIRRMQLMCGAAPGICRNYTAEDIRAEIARRKREKSAALANQDCGQSEGVINSQRVEQGL
jgi:hypothetical protein